jgi:predicted amidohydrolase YtcJ
MKQQSFPGSSSLVLADLVIRAGTIYAMTEDRKRFRSLAIRDQWIVAVSEDPHGLDDLISAGTRVLDDSDLILLPALEDSHNHLILAAQDSLMVPVNQAHTMAEVVELIRQRAAITPPGEWISTSAAWHEANLQEGRLPTAQELDAATSEHPVLVRRGGHVVVVNSQALRLGGIMHDTPDPAGGTIVRQADGTPTGVLLEKAAFEFASKLVPPPNSAQMVEGLKRTCQNYHAYGIGAIRDPLVTRAQMRVYQTLWERGELTMRCRILFATAMGEEPLAEKLALIDGLGVQSGFGDDLLKIWGLKFGLDGGAEGGALDEPYIGQPDYYGHLLWDPEEMFQAINFSIRQGWRIGTHVVGDRAVRTALDVYERVIHENPGLQPGTLVLEHAFLANAEQRARAIRLGVAVTVQHPLLYTLAPALLKGWGEKRTREVMPVRAWLDEGAQIAAGTDHPVSSYNPYLSLWGLVTRGTEHAGVQGPEYAIDRYTALRLYTAAGAELDGESQRRGTLQPRKLADLIALRTDPTTCPVDALPHLKPVFTMVGGRSVYDPEGILSDLNL